MLSRFHLIPERHGQTDGRTDTQCQTDRFAISIVRQTIFNNRERPVTHIQCFANNQR